MAPQVEAAAKRQPRKSQKTLSPEALEARRRKLLIKKLLKQSTETTMKSPKPKQIRKKKNEPGSSKQTTSKSDDTIDKPKLSTITKAVSAKSKKPFVKIPKTVVVKRIRCVASKNSIRDKNIKPIKKIISTEKPNIGNIEKLSKEKPIDRSRSPGKKKTFSPPRSSSAPLMTTSSSEESSTEDLCSSKSPGKKSKRGESPKMLFQIPQNKLKESETKVIETINFSTKSAIEEVKESHKNLITITSPFTDSQTGRKKLIGEVKPIPRVKGTILEKIKPETDKRKAVSPSKNLDEKAIEKDNQNTETDKKKITSPITKSPEENKKLDKDMQKNLKSQKKPTKDDSESVDISNVEPDVTSPLDENSTTKKKILVKRPKQNTKAKVLKSKGEVVRKTKLSKKVLKSISIKNEPDSSKASDTDDVTYSFPEEEPKKIIERKKKVTLKTKGTALKKPKLFKSVPKKIKIENKDEQSSDSGVKPKNSPKKSNVKISNLDKQIKENKKQNDELSSSSAEPTSSDDYSKSDDENDRERCKNYISDSDEDIKFSLPKSKSQSSSSESTKKAKCSKSKKKTAAEETMKRMKLLGFWTGPKRHREASLNAQAKVQCLYENESRSHVELGLMKTVDKGPPRWRDSPKKKPIKEEIADSSHSDSEYEKRIKVETGSSEEDSSPPTRTLRHAPGSRGAGKYWEIKTSSSEESEAEHRKQKVEKKKSIPKTKTASEKNEPSKVEIKKEPVTKTVKKPDGTVKKKRNRTDIVMDLKDMVVKKRMASLNATAILAASYEKRSPKSSNKDESTSDSASSGQEDVSAKKLRIIERANEKAEALKREQAGSSSASDVKSTSSKSKLVIVNQEADVTITGMYSTHHHEGFCTVSGMQYRISATSHTQTMSTSGDKDLNVGGPSPSYTPLGALSSMHPPSGVLPPHPHPGGILGESRGPLGGGGLGRRAGCSSAFSAPPHHHPQPHTSTDSDRSPPPGYYQPAGPLITAGPLHGGFKDSGGPSPYQYPQQVMHYGAGFAGQYSTGPVSSAGVSQYGGVGDPCYGGPGRTQPPPAPPACYRPPTTYRTPTRPGDSQNTGGADAYSQQYCPPCYQHPHGPPRPIAYLDTAYQSCPCPMQTCPKNVLTGPAIGNPPTGGGPKNLSPPGGSRAPDPPTTYCREEKRKAIISNAKDPPLLNQVLKNECGIKNIPELRSDGTLISGRSPKREYFADPVRQEVTEGRSGCCAVAINPSLSVMPPEALGPPSPARGSAGASIPQPPDPLHRSTSHLLPPPSHSLQRRARIGKAMVRKSIGVEENPGHNTMLLMCQPQTLTTDVNSTNKLTTPLKVDVDNKVQNVKSEVDSGDEVILIESPNSKMAPIDLSSSEENCTDKSENETQDENNFVIDLSKDVKSEKILNSSNVKKNGFIQQAEVQALKEHNVDKDVTKKQTEMKQKPSTKRRCSQPKMEVELDLDINDSISSNGIGEHVKLQKRQKASPDNSKKSSLLTGTYKDLIKKNSDKLMKLNNGKRQLNTIKPKLPPKIIDAEKTPNKRSYKRKSVSPVIDDVPVIKKKKLSLKATDKKNLITEPETMNDKSKDCKVKNNITHGKAKNPSLMDNLLLKNSMAKNAECKESNLQEIASPTNNTCISRNKKCLKDSISKGRTVLNINNNIVKKISESECGHSILEKSRSKSKSPASAANRKVDKIFTKDPNKIKCQASVESKGPVLKTLKAEKMKRSSKTHFGTKVHSGKRKSKSSDEIPPLEALALSRRLSLTPRWSNGWTWEGEPQQSRVYINNEDVSLWANCWSSMRHARAGDAVRRGDCVLLRAGSRRTEAPYVARVAQLWENPSDGEMMMSLLWYYRPEHTERGKQCDDSNEEVFASRHRDINSVACIEDKCYVLTLNEYCRYKTQLKLAEENMKRSLNVVPNMPVNEITPNMLTNDGKVPPNTSADLVLFCRKVYDFRQKKVIKNPAI